jgi:hypothetical protein
MQAINEVNHRQLQPETKVSSAAKYGAHPTRQFQRDIAARTRPMLGWCVYSSTWPGQSKST